MTTPQARATANLKSVVQFFDYVDLMLEAGMITEARQHLSELREVMIGASEAERAIAAGKLILGRK